ncbi:MAG: GNAT family N-acetyltransferase [Cyanobacteria bacterium J06639_16]
MFQTKRLLVRHITDADVEAMHAVYGDAEAMKWVDDGQPLDRQGCIQWIDVTHRNYMSRGYGMSALVLKRTDAIAGFCGLVHPGRQPQVESNTRFYAPIGGRG